ncbi:glycosyltransferase family 4 protein [Larkinella humicola]|uniref:Glycosyltransferase family 4 protein n=1 Tax=Larkinella humicola TaxID=2607654 RepID=A0A5N1JEB4_9BACT|nr:glycosyltransferase family 1 protein [Larkinella humicola]KAA9353455.1 glycosyltransferase family 4 protein [Larkinella humicola]
MRIVIFCHPSFPGSQSMPRYARWLASGMQARGHEVESWQPKPFFYTLSVPGAFKKWLGYIDQYIVFPIQVRQRINGLPKQTLFVFADHALGPWVPLVADRPHVVHCHDFLAQRSALGEIPENQTGWTGKLYQAYIRRGYRKGRNFISVSNKTQGDLHGFLKASPSFSEVIYNGVNPNYTPGQAAESRSVLSARFGIDLSSGYLVHVGGNQWYKNRKGVLEMYDAWRKAYSRPMPLLMIGEEPTPELAAFANASAFQNDIHFLTGVDDQHVVHAYRGAQVFLFPSLAEGFGWPIAEALACGCRVLTTSEAPMTEVAGTAAALLRRRPLDELDSQLWADEGAVRIQQILNESAEKRREWINEGLMNVKRFTIETATDQIEDAYKTILGAYHFAGQTHSLV